MECGLGLYDLALLHLVAHSLYKAHAFLGAGGRVTEYRQRLLGEAAADSSSAVRRVFAGMAAAVLALGVVAGLAAAWTAGFPETQLPWIVTLILGLGLGPLLGATLRDLPLGLLRVASVVFAYLVWHAVAGSLTGLPVATPPAALALWSAACFIALYGVQTVLRSAPKGWLARTLHAPIHAGLHLDERFQRLTLRIWPAPRVVPRSRPSRDQPMTEPSGETP
jgi:NAD(P)H-quinone oxidoreductase subunit 5